MIYEYHSTDQDLELITPFGSIHGINPTFRALSNSLSQSPLLDTQSDYWIDFSTKLNTGDFKALSGLLDTLNSHLCLRSFFVGHSLTIADFAVYGALKGSAIFTKQFKVGKLGTVYLVRWFSYMNTLAGVKKANDDIAKVRESGKEKGDSGSLEITLPGAVMGKVVTRFPPEPSGYLHIGHAKAALLNNYFAKAYKGKMILRFDDTNPSNEKAEYEESIKEDLRLLEVEVDQVTHTSDHFEKLLNYAMTLVAAGKAYCDNTDQDTMRNQRFDGIESKCRNQSIKENTLIFMDMQKGKGEGYCLRAKISMFDKNKCMRDPVIYRQNSTPHHVLGSKYAVYPTYDFACPIVDSLEGVTHALRTIEYRDRNAQYAWFQDTLSIRKVTIWDFGRLNFIYTLLSKRKFGWFVDNGLVDGWDDPRFATVRGILRRGLTVEGLRNYIVSQGATQRELLLEWDKIWAMNKKVIDPVAARHTALASLVKVTVEDFDSYSKLVPKHKKNPQMGDKLTVYSSIFNIEQEDAATLKVGEEITMMEWGNIIISDIETAGKVVLSISAKLNLSGDFKKTKKKLTWLALQDKANVYTDLNLVQYDYLITKKKLDEHDKFEDFINPVSKYSTKAFGDLNMHALKKGQIIQLERKGFYICDKEKDSEGVVELVYIPDGKLDSVAIKTPQKLKIDDMYQIASIYKDVKVEGEASKMYPLKSVYE